MAITDDTQTKVAIAASALKVLTDAGLKVTKLDCLMDIEYVNESCPLRLRELLDADDYNFAHDIFGIYRHFNRQTKQIENFFLPRFAA